MNLDASNHDFNSTHKYKKVILWKVNKYYSYPKPNKQFPLLKTDQMIAKSDELNQ